MHDTASPIEAALVEDNARLLAEAFEIDAAYRYLFPDAATRGAGLGDFFARNQRTHLPFRCTYVSRDPDGALAATVTLRPPGGVNVSLLTMLRRGLLPFALRHGREAVKRLLWLKDTYDALERDASRGEPHFHVHMMAVRPDLQGKGLGSALLHDVLARGFAQHGRAPTVLTTHLPRNVVYYRRAGFEVSDERTLQPPGSAPYTVWSMRRENTSV